MKTIAILCGGGPAPGINTVIGSVAKSFIKSGYRVIGINEGYKGLFSENPDILEFDYALADTVFTRGGSVIAMSRFKPKDSDFNTNLFVKENISLLVTIGGDDTASTANRLSKYLEANNIHISNIHVPKTIDNDLPLPEGVPTFGFASAKEMGTNIAKVIKIEASTSLNWYLVMSMGREAGHLAFEVGKSSHADMIVIPEMFDRTKITVDKVIRLLVSAIVKKRILGIKYGVNMVSEGIFHFLEDEDIATQGIVFDFDEHGHPELSNVSKAHIINKILMKRLKDLNLSVKSRPMELGYSLRCVDPCAYDLSYCTTLGEGVKKLYDEGYTACMVSQDINTNVIAIYLKDVEDECGKIKTRLVDMDNESVKLTYATGIFYLTNDDVEAAKKFIPNPEDYVYSNILNH